VQRSRRTCSVRAKRPWVAGVLYVLTILSLRLPLEHTCWNLQVSNGSLAASETLERSNGFDPDRDGRRALSSRRSLTAGQSDGICLACALSQSIKSHDTAPEGSSPALATSYAMTTSELTLPFFDFCFATSKRGPPLS